MAILFTSIFIISFQLATEQKRKLDNEKMELFNAGYRNGAYNVLNTLVFCYGVNDIAVTTELNIYRELVAKHDGINLDNEYPCTE